MHFGKTVNRFWKKLWKVIGVMVGVEAGETREGYSAHKFAWSIFQKSIEVKMNSMSSMYLSAGNAEAPTHTT